MIRHLDPEEHLRRACRVEAAMGSAGLDALIAYSVSNQPGPVAYLAGYETSFGLHDVCFFVLAPHSSPRYSLLTNAFWDAPQESAWAEEVFVTSDFGRKLAELLPASTRRVGIAGYRFFPAALLQALRDALPAASFEDATDLLKNVAKIKSPLEIDLIRRAAQMTEAGARAFLAAVEPGVDERLLAHAVNGAMLEAGADGPCFPTILMTGPRVVASIGFAARRRLENGDQVNILCGARYRGYGTEIARVVTVGPPASAVQHIMEVTAEMHEAMQEAVGPGVRAGAVAHAAVAVAQKHGVEQYMFRSQNNAASQGHGMGCWYLEPPMLNPDSNDILEDGMVVILEARLGKPGVGGAVLTEPWLIRASGAERLAQLSLRTWTG